MQGLAITDDVFVAALGDGAVVSISEEIEPEMLRRLFHRDDGKPVELP